MRILIANVVIQEFVFTDLKYKILHKEKLQNIFLCIFSFDFQYSVGYLGIVLSLCAIFLYHM